MDALAKALRIPTGRTVINDTGITGPWEFDLQFATPEEPASDKPSVFTAVQEMGLRLESSRAPLQVLVVEMIHQPTDNRYWATWPPHYK
jgi:uncharacterized protein (TIGR03435 family)